MYAKLKKNIYAKLKKNLYAKLKKNMYAKLKKSMYSKLEKKICTTTNLYYKSVDDKQKKPQKYVRKKKQKQKSIKNKKSCKCHFYATVQNTLASTEIVYS
jgi:hypothetical protein